MVKPMALNFSKPAVAADSRRRRLVVAGWALLAVSALTGCQNYNEQTYQFSQASRRGGLVEAVVQIDRQAEAKAGTKDEILFRLEQGATLRTAAMAAPAFVPAIPVATSPGAPATEPPAAAVHEHYFRRSISAFDLAEDRVNYWEEQAKVKLGSEIGSALTTQANLPYRGRSYDKVMMNTYKALDYLALGQFEQARVELNRSLQRQRDAVAANEKRIVAAQVDEETARRGAWVEAEGQSAAYDPQKAVNDPVTSAALRSSLQASIARMQPYGDYVNPFAVFLDGLYHSVLGLDGSDRERGRKSFERVAGLVPSNSFARIDLEAATKAAEGQPIMGVTYVIFETGTAPSRRENRIDIPTFLFTRRLAYVGAAFPTLEYHDDYLRQLDVRAGGETVSTAVVASMDSVVANDFKNEWPSIVTRTIFTTATKAIAQAGVQKELESRGGMAGRLLGEIAGTVVNASTNIADTRTWSSLPKEFQYARLPTPPDRTLILRAGTQENTVTVELGSVIVVYVRSASLSSPLFISQFVLQ